MRKFGNSEFSPVVEVVAKVYTYGYSILSHGIWFAAFK